MNRPLERDDVDMDEVADDDVDLSTFNAFEALRAIEIYTAQAREALDDEHEGDFRLSVTNLANAASQLRVFAERM